MLLKNVGPLVLVLLGVAVATPARAQTFGLCEIPIPTPAAPGMGNTNVNVTVQTCGLDEDTIVQASLSGGSPVAVGPVPGIDATATATALAEAAPLLGFSPSELAASGVTEIAQSAEFIEEVYAISANDPALFGIDYIGDPANYFTWIAIGPVDVEVLVSQATLTTHEYRLDLVEAASVPALSGALSAVLAGAMVLGGVTALRRRRAAPGRV